MDANLDDEEGSWAEQEARVRARIAAGVGAGVARREDAARMSGLEFMRAMLRGELPYPHMADTLGFVIVGVSEGRAVFQGTPDARHLNPMGTVHGGWYATMLDSALGCAVHTAMPAGRAYTTAELGLNLVRGAAPGREPLRAVARVIHAGRQLATAEGRVVDAAGRVYAHGTTTCLVFETAPPR